MSLCTDLTLVKADALTITAEPLRCRCWTCDHCVQVRRAELKRDARDGNPDTFLTLTVNPAFGASPDHRATLLSRSWWAIRRAARKRYGYDRMPFIAVFERTKKGEPHLHILARCKWLDQAWLSDFMRRRMLAPIVDIRRILSKRLAAWYVTKYLTKAPHKFDGVKRYWKSRDWLDPGAGAEQRDETEPGDWHVMKQSFHSFIITMARRGWACELHPRRAIFTRPTGPPP